jgi:hypothetical protein
MQSETGQAEIQDGGGRHLENQLYVITTVFMIRLCSNFYHSTAPYQLAVFENVIGKRDKAEIQDGGGRHLRKSIIRHNYRIYDPTLFNFLP